jgi:ribosomal protein S18 acetylase RimI-like enzyme
MTDKIMTASHADIAQMVAICESNLMVNNREKFSDEDFSKRGFLIKPLQESVAKNMITDQGNFVTLVLKNGDEVLGYLLGHDISKTDKIFIDEVLHLLQPQENEKIFYHYQIAKKPGSKNVGEKLLLAMVYEIKKRGYSKLVCKIVQRPFPNEKSINFHEKLGFKQIGEIENNKIILGIYQKQI